MGLSRLSGLQYSKHAGSLWVVKWNLMLGRGVRVANMGGDCKTVLHLT